MPEGKLPKWVTPYALAGQSLDGITTNIALHKGAIESNPLMPSNPTVNSIVKASYTAGSLYLMNKLKKEHPKLATAAGIMIGTGGMIPGLINYNRMRQMK